MFSPFYSVGIVINILTCKISVYEHDNPSFDKLFFEQNVGPRKQKEVVWGLISGEELTTPKFLLRPLLKW